LRTGQRRCVTPTPGNTVGLPRTAGVPARWSKSRTRRLSLVHGAFDAVGHETDAAPYAKPAPSALWLLSLNELGAVNAETHRATASA
jgi:hypothetical protein